MFRRRIMAGGRKGVAIKRPVDMEMGIARSRRRLELRRSGVWVWRPYRFHRVLVFHSRHIGKFEPPFFCPELYRRTREPSNARAFLQSGSKHFAKGCASFNSPALTSRRFARYLPNWNLPTSSSSSKTAAEQRQHTFTATSTLLSKIQDYCGETLPNKTYLINSNCGLKKI